MIGETAKLYKCDKPLKNRCFNEFYTNYRDKQNDDDEKKAEATRLLATGIANSTDIKSQKLNDNIKKTPQNLHIETSKLCVGTLDSFRQSGRDSQKNSSRRVFIKGRVKNLCKVFQEKMDMLEKTLPESKKNVVINQIHGTVMKIQKKVENEDRNQVILHKNLNENKANRLNATPKKYEIKKSDIVNTGVFNYASTANPKSVNNLVKTFNKINKNDCTPKPIYKKLNNDVEHVHDHVNEHVNEHHPQPLDEPHEHVNEHVNKPQFIGYDGLYEEDNNELDTLDNDISELIDNVIDEQNNYMTPGYRYDMSPMSDGDILEDILRDLDDMIINQVNEEAEFNLSDDEDQFEDNSIDDQFAWFFKTVSNHVLSKPNNDEIDQGTKEQLDWFLS